MDTQIQPKLHQPHPLSGTTMNGADMMVQVLADEGVRTLFGYSGGAILPTFDAVFRYNRANREDGKDPMPIIVPVIKPISRIGTSIISNLIGSLVRLTQQPAAVQDPR